jgi:hypothetical protein
MDIMKSRGRAVVSRVEGMDSRLLGKGADAMVGQKWTVEME